MKFEDYDWDTFYTSEGRAAAQSRKKKIEDDLSARAKRLKDAGNSNRAISEMMDFPESTIRSLLSR